MSTSLVDRLWYGQGRPLALLTPVAWLYRAVSESRRRKAWHARNELLPVPVVVVGNITAGGTGKTPVVEKFARGFVEELVEVLDQRRLLPERRSSAELMRIASMRLSTNLGCCGLHVVCGRPSGPGTSRPITIAWTLPPVVGSMITLPASSWLRAKGSCLISWVRTPI